MREATWNAPHIEMIVDGIKALIKKTPKQSFRRSKVGRSQHDFLNLRRINGETTESPLPCTCNAPAFITRQAGSTAYLLPFDTDMWCSLVTDAARHWSQRSQMTFWIVFFFLPPPSQSIICLTMAAHATPGTPMELEVVAACLLRSHLPQTNPVCVYTRGRVDACLRRRGHKDGFLTTVLHLMPSTELNCRMTTLLFSCHRDFLLLYRMNH